MAGTIKLQQVMQVSNSTVMAVSKSTTITQTGDGQWSEVLPIATSDTTVTPGVSSPGWFMLENLDETNYVQWGMYDGSTARYVCRLKAGKTHGPVELDSGATLILKANTASVNVRITMAES